MIRRLRADFREFPATMGFCAAWVVVFLLMALTQFWQGPSSKALDLVLSIRGGHRFGDLTVNELFHGQVWRALTATFVHYGVLHIGMNLIGMYQLGALVESWYGSRQFVAIYVLIGAGGNLISALIRHALHSNPLIHSGGGSTVVLGLVGLCAVVGWRAKTRLGDYLRGQMVKILGFTALLGVMLPMIDNWGHAGGALVGGAIGLRHRWLSRTLALPLAKWAGRLGMLCLVASAAAQIHQDQSESPARSRSRLSAQDRALRTLIQVGQLHRLATLPRPIGRGSFVPRQAVTALPAAINALESSREVLDRGATAADYERLLALLESARRRPTTPAEYREFDQRLVRVARQVVAQRNLALRKVMAPGGTGGLPASVTRRSKTLADKPPVAPGGPVSWGK